MKFKLMGGLKSRNLNKEVSNIHSILGLYRVTKIGLNTYKKKICKIIMSQKFSALDSSQLSN